MRGSRGSSNNERSEAVAYPPGSSVATRSGGTEEEEG
jgi:hypothetical protein